MRKSLATIFRFSGGVKKYLFITVISTALAVFFQFLTPQIIRFTVDYVIGTEPPALPPFVMVWIESLGGRDFLRSSLMLIAAMVVLCALLNSLFAFVSRMSAATFAESVIKRLRNTLFEHTQRLPYSWHVEHQTGDIIQRCTSDVEVVRNFVSHQLLQIIRTFLLITVSLALMFSMNVTLSIVALVFIPLVILYSTIFFSSIRKKFRVCDELEGELTVAVQENLTGVRVVRAFGRERHELDQFDEKNEKYTGSWVRLGSTLGLYWGLGDLATGLQIISIIAVGAILASRDALTLGEFLVFVSYNHMLAWPVRAMGRILSDFSKTSVSTARIRDILDAEAEKPEPEGIQPDMRGDIVFENVSFSYGSEPLIKNLSFTIEGGTTFGILGATGSGKSTIAALLNRLYELEEGSGRITIGGVDIRRIERSYRRRNVGVVLQEPFLFSKTIGENISIAAPGARLEEIRTSAAAAALDESVMGFQKGYDTVVGERGVTLSGGQKQRVAIARTLMMRPPVMVFDDSMSAVDLETDAKIRASLREVRGSATIIIISHRINTLLGADKILVLENGEIAELGTPEELMEKGGIFRRTYEMQSEAASDLLIREEDGI
jgi:ATP-binding cassette subfamily B protein